MLDSLQGIWVNSSDSLDSIIISDRNWVHRNDTYSINSTNRIFFSDTVVSGDNLQNFLFDTTVLSGNYIITLRQSNNHLTCWDFLGFYTDNSSTPTFSFCYSSYGTMRSTFDYRKIQ